MIQPIEGRITPLTSNGAANAQTAGTVQGMRPFEEMLSEAIANTEKIDTGADFTDLLEGITGFSALRLNLYTTDNASSVSASQAGEAGSMQVSDGLLRFLADHEGFSSTPYRGVDAQNLTIGYGHVIGTGESYTALTQPQALSLLRQDVQRYADSVNREFAGCNLTQNQFDALVSFSYNLGANIWSKTPRLTSDIKSVASAETLREDFARCSNSNGRFVQGLYNRRMDEWQMFCGK